MEKEKYYKMALLDFFEKHAPQASIKDCMSYAKQFQRAMDDDYYNKCVIAVLSTFFLEGSGKLKEHAVFKADEMTDAMKKAMDTVSTMNAWVKCGPGPGMAEFLKKFVGNNTP